jgi:hypothetical protein
MHVVTVINVMTSQRLKMDENYPCKCGHDLSLHVNLDKSVTEDQLRFLAEKDKGYNFCICSKFQGDNLKYLEQQDK